MERATIFRTKEMTTNNFYLKKFDEILDREETEDRNAGLCPIDIADSKDYETIQWLLQGKEKSTGPEQVWTRGWPYIDYDFNNWNAHRSDLVNLERGPANVERELAKRPGIKSTGWYNLVGAYTSRHITYNSDLLPGLSGLAHLVQELTGFKYIAGLWYGHPTVFTRSLMWSVARDNVAIRNEEAIPSLNGSPSWSWGPSKGKSAMTTNIPSGICRRP
jgi:hypothetical protein